MVQMTPEEVIAKIVEVASAISWQAGVGGMETAGQIVSVLHTHPEKIAGFLAGEIHFIDDDALRHPEKGCLNWHAINGQIVSPAEFRASKSQHDH